MGLNPLTTGQELFCQKHIFWTFWRFSALIYSKGHLQHDSMSFFSLAPCFTKSLLRHVQKTKF